APQSPDRVVKEFFKSYCLDCHGPDEMKSGLRLDTLNVDVSEPTVYSQWREILSRVKSGQMPPKGETAPNAEQVSDFAGRISDRLTKAAQDKQTEGRVVLRRLNATEYENTVCDLFHVNVPVAEMLPDDAVSHGFDNVGVALNVSPVLMERYLDAAD